MKSTVFVSEVLVVVVMDGDDCDDCGWNIDDISDDPVAHLWHCINRHTARSKQTLLPISKGAQVENITKHRPRHPKSPA